VRVLLDTHTFLWWCTGDSRLSPAAQAIIESEHDLVFLSVISVWEIVIKAARDRLVLPEEPRAYVASRMDKGTLVALPVALRHALYVAELPLVHRDPFDRMLVAQSRVEQLPIVTFDTAIRAYDVEVIW
jgi:PIN domain nuclease of toxin-antitoxin system